MYGYTREVSLSFEKTEEKIIEELKKEEFGVLTEIDVKATLKKKMDVDFPEYKILGACNPPLAHKALQFEIEVGLLLPCNIIIYKKEDKIFVSTILPTVAMTISNNPLLKPIANEVEKKLKNVIDSI